MRIVRPQIPLVLLALAFMLDCGVNRQPEEGFAISLAGSGEVILSDRHIAAYIPGGHRLRLSPEGIERWESFVRIEATENGPVRKLGPLTGRELVVTIRGRCVLRGRFGSRLQSTIGPGVRLLDTIGAPTGELWFQSEVLPGDSAGPSLDLAPLESYFRDRDKLGSVVGPPAAGFIGTG